MPSARRSESYIQWMLQSVGMTPEGLTPQQVNNAISKAKRVAKRLTAAKKAACKRLHDSRLRKAMPPWADRAEIAAIYAEARRLTAVTGRPHEVDHIEPLLGREICGLHVEFNLRIVLRWVNRQKSNKRPELIGI